MKRIITYLWTGIIALLTCSSFVLAQESERETIGLVLAGGGARGIAHAGVIRALEEMQVPIDAIAGTSMGALVGGLYASGKDADELQEVIFNMDWTEAFEDRKDRGGLPPRRKSDDYDYPSSISFSFKDGDLALPMGLIQGQQVRLIIKELMTDVSHIKNFDQFPIPFRAVATDVETGDAYIFSEGDIVTAMRSSMSIPGLLAPVEYDGKLLMDGGMANNIPVDIARDMGVDRLIVIDIGTPLKGRDEITSVISLADQIVGFLTRKNSIDQLETLGPNDFLIRPDLDAIGMLSFDEQEVIYQRGYEAGMALANELLTLQIDDPAWAAYITSKSVPIVGKPLINFIAISNDSPLSDDIIKVRIRQPIGEPLDRDILLEDISAIYALDYWELIDYEVQNTGSDYGLLIKAKAKSWGGHQLKVGMNLVADLDSASDINIGSSYLLKGINKLGGEIYARVQVGDTILFNGEFYQPLDIRSRFFVVPQLSFDDHQVLTLGPEYDPEITIGSWRVRETRANIAAGVNIFSSSQLRVGMFRSKGEYEVEASSDHSLANGGFDKGGTFATYRFDRLDNAYFPQNGAFLYANYEKNDTGFGSDYNFERWELFGQAAFQFGASKDNTIIFTARTGQSRNATNDPQNYYELGGLFNLSGVSQNFYAGRQMAFTMVQYQRKLSKDSVIPLNLPVYAGVSLEGGQLWSERSEMSFDDFIFSGSIYLAVDTPIGPLHIAYGRTEDSRDAFYLSLGWPFFSNTSKFGR